MNNSNYAADHILEYLLKNGWVSTNCYSSLHVKSDIEQIIINAALSNVKVSNNLGVTTLDSATTYTIPAYKFD
jgi:hypothetical protein